ncbi:HAD family hydrolase [Arthrobacter rhombi]|uniref:HAD family hydrolase n=1 Tax=Arthrobacter rhombi TaxID=71253 RepID=UPI003FD5C408
MRSFKAVGFDLDGTLFDHHGSASQAVDALIRVVGAEPSARVRQVWFENEDAEFERWRLGEINFQEQRRRRLRAVMLALGLSSPENDGDLNALFDQYLVAYRSSWKPFHASAEVLTDLRRQGFRPGVLTNGAQAQQVDKLQAVGLYGLVNVVFISEAPGVQKPGPSACRALDEGLGVHPAECVFVGDHPEHDDAGARAVGMKATLTDRYEENGVDLTAALGKILGG